MPLYKLEDFDPNYSETFAGDNIKGLEVYRDGTEEKIGSVTDVLVDDQGHFRYIILDLGVWILGKKVLLPMGRSRIDYNTKRVYALGLNREQAEQLPEYSDRTSPDYDYEEQVRGIYRTSAPNVTAGSGTAMAIGSTERVAADPKAKPVATPEVAGTPTPYSRDNYDYKNEPSLYALSDLDHQTFKLYEERLIASKSRAKTGEVTVGKRVETEIAQASVPIERERVVIERVTPNHPETVVNPSEVNFQEGEVARIEIYEEIPDIRKEAFVREEVIVKKVVDRNTVDTEETIRKEQLDVQTDGQPVISNADSLPSERI